MKAFYLKELVERKLFLPSGAPVPFQPVDQIYGILATEDPAIIGELNKAVQNRVGGVMKLTEAEWEDWSKKKAGLISQAFLPRERESLGAMSQAELQRLRAQGAAAVVGPVSVQPSINPTINSPSQVEKQATHQKVEPLKIPTEFTKPVGKMPARKGSAPAPVPPPANAP